MFTDIYEYMKKDRNERRSHLVLKEPCVKIGGHDSREYRGQLAHHLKTTIPSGRNIVLCHACHEHGCSNVNHLYWGTGKDNHTDQIENGTFTNFAARTLAKHGAEKVSEMRKAAGSKGGKAGGGKNRLSQKQIGLIREVIDTVPDGHGKIAKLAKMLNVSHTSIRRYIDTYVNPL